MKVILEIGGNKVLLPNCKNLDAFLGAIAGAQKIDYEHCKNDRDYADPLYRNEGCDVIQEKPAPVELRVVADHQIKTAEEWREIVAAVEASKPAKGRDLGGAATSPHLNGKEVLARS